MIHLYMRLLGESDDEPANRPTEDPRRLQKPNQRWQANCGRKTFTAPQYLFRTGLLIHVFAHQAGAGT